MIDEIEKFYKWFAEEYENDLQTIGRELKSYHLDGVSDKPSEGHIHAGKNEFYFEDSAFIDLEVISSEQEIDIEDITDILKKLGFKIQ